MEIDGALLANLTRMLGEDEEAGFAQFRKLFFEALERRQLGQCQSLLDILSRFSATPLQQEYLYHKAVLLSELRQFDQAEAILRRLLAAELSPEQQAKTSLELAIQLDEQGQWAEAEPLYLNALAIYQALEDIPGQAGTYNNLGLSIRFQVEEGEAPPARLAEALACHQAAMALAQAGDDPWEVARSWHGLGVVHGLLRDYSAALAAFQEDLKLSRELGDLYAQGITQSDLAVLVYQPQGQWVEAAVALEEAITLLSNCQDDLHLAEVLARRGNLLAQQQRLEEALASYEAALVRAESIRTRLTTPTAQASYRAMAEFIYSAPLFLHLRGGMAAQAFSAAERSRARVLADLLAGQAAQPHSQLPADLLERRGALRQSLNQLYAADSPSSSQITPLEEALANLDRQIELFDPAYASLEKVMALTAEGVSRLLPPEAVLLTYTGDEDDQLWILVVTAAGVEAKPAPGIRVQWLRGFLADCLDGIRQGMLVPDPHTGHLGSPSLFPPLYQALLAPVMETLQAARTTYIVPYGPLYYLPLGALSPSLSAMPPLLAGGRRVVYAPSATILLNYCHRRPPSPWRGWLAVAPEDRRLQFTQGAAEALVRLNSGLALTGRVATRQAFLNQAGQYRLVCFLGHAYFDQRYPMSSRLQFADDSLRASGILRELRLQADLVILSACETGRSRVLRGDEMLGLSRAMLYAGTPSLLVTLWPVHEIPSRLLVEKLGEQLSETTGLAFDPALALASAQRWLQAVTWAEAQHLVAAWNEAPAARLEADLLALWQMTHPGQAARPESQLFAHPFFWSPYILMGDQRP